MKMLAFDPLEYRDTFSEQGWVHVQNAIDPEFLQELRSFSERSFQSHVVTGSAIGGEKEQALYEFPPSVDFPGEVFDAIASLCSLDPRFMTLSERHIKAYEPDAEPNPKPHKDRAASQVSVGLSIIVPRGSRLVLYPYDQVEANPFTVGPAFRKSLDSHELPEVALRTARRVEIEDQPGDFVAFRGSRMWHLREHPAGVVNLYLKFNDFDFDPLGEDPTTASRRSTTVELLEGEQAVMSSTPRIGRRLENVSRSYARERWEARLQASVWEEATFSLTDAQFAIMRAVDGERTVRQLANDLGYPEDVIEADVRRLAGRGALDLVPASLS